MSYRGRPAAAAIVALSVTGLFGAALPSGGASAQEVTESAGEARVRGFLEEVLTLRADFTQSLFDSELELVQESHGTLLIKRPGRFRWDYVNPYEQLILADGERVWMYDSDLEQATVRELDATLASTPAMLLSGAGDITEGYRFGESYERDGVTWVELAPRQQDTDFQAVRIGFGTDNIRYMELRDTLDQITRIEFSAVKRNPELADTQFVFVPPPGTDVIGATGSIAGP